MWGKKKEPKDSKAVKKAKSKGLFGGYATRQEQLDAMEMGLQPSPLKQQKGK